MLLRRAEGDDRLDQLDEFAASADTDSPGDDPQSRAIDEGDAEKRQRVDGSLEHGPPHCALSFTGVGNLGLKRLTVGPAHRNRRWRLVNLDGPGRERSRNADLYDVIQQWHGETNTPCAHLADRPSDMWWHADGLVESG